MKVEVERWFPNRANVRKCCDYNHLPKLQVPAIMRLPTFVGSGRRWPAGLVRCFSQQSKSKKVGAPEFSATAMCSWRRTRESVFFCAKRAVGAKTELPCE